MPIHREELLYVPHVGHDSALIAWGAYYLKHTDSKDHDPAGSFRFKLLDDEKLKDDQFPGGSRPRGSIGRNTTSFGPARVLVEGPPGHIVEVNVPDKSFAWVKGLEPNTHYRYRVEVAGKPWAATPCAIRMKDENDGIAVPDPGSRVHAFTTFPRPDESAGPFTFAVIGDPGTGKEEQVMVGHALAGLINSEGVRFVLTMGDNIYMKPKLGLLGKVFSTLTGRNRMSGDEDDDWFASYFLPYRDVISRVPVFPCLGNHDSENTEDDDDLAQVVDNLFLEERFPEYAQAWRLGEEAFDTMFYRFRFGRDAEFIAVDTSFSDKQGGAEVIFEHTRGKRQPPLASKEHSQFIDDLLAESAPRWRIPFGHHPPFSLGPKHPDTPMIQALARRFSKAAPSLRVWLAGHEHNFQHHREGQVHYLLSGAAGKCNELDEVKRPPPHACCHNSVCHCLLVTVTEASIRVRLIDQDGHTGKLTPCTAFPRHEGDEILIPA